MSEYQTEKYPSQAFVVCLADVRAGARSCCTYELLTDGKARTIVASCSRGASRKALRSSEMEIMCPIRSSNRSSLDLPEALPERGGEEQKRSGAAFLPEQARLEDNIY